MTLQLDILDLEYSSYQAILERMLSRIPDSIDKREGSIIFDALAPAAYELARYYLYLNEVYANTFLDTASGEALDYRGSEFSVFRNPATKAVRKGVFTDGTGAALDVAIGNRFTTMDGDDSLNFVVREKIEAGVFRLECEIAGTLGNEYVGRLETLMPIDNLATATMTDIITPGEDIESDDDYRERIKRYIRSTAQDGNVAQYEEWVDNYAGLGRCKVFPLWQGVNTVKVSILNSLQTPADAELIADFQEYLDPSTATSFTGDGTTTAFTVTHKPRYLNLVTVNGTVSTAYTYEPTDGSLAFTTAPAADAVIIVRDHGGLGNGVAPIGAVVTVTTASELDINISATLTLVNGYTLEQAKMEVTALLTTFLNNLAYTANRVNYIELGAIVLSGDTVEAVSGLTVNNGILDIELNDEEIPVVGTLTFSEATGGDV